MQTQCIESLDTARFIKEYKMVKSGIKTTELWLTLITNVLTALVAFGALTQNEADMLSKVIIALIQLVIVLVPTVTYIIQRTSLKKAALNNGGPFG